MRQPLLLVLFLLVCGPALAHNPPALYLQEDPAPANQPFRAIFYYYTKEAAHVEIQVDSISHSEVVFKIVEYCFFLCPGESAYRHVEFEVPALPPGDYTARFPDYHLDEDALFTISVSIGVSQEEPIRLYPPEPEPFEPFMVEMLVGDSGYLSQVRQATVTVQGQNVVIEHLLPGYSQPGIPDSVVTPIQGLGPGDYTLTTMWRDAGGNTVEEYSLDFTIDEMPQPITAMQLYQSTLDRYFLSVDELEIDSLLNLSGSEWAQVTNDGFAVWPAEGPAPEVAVPVCRYYSAEANTIFYTADEDECEFLKDTFYGWTYQGIAFQTLPAAGGACPGGSVPVLRLYNNGGNGTGGNHRYTARAETFRTMAKQGWTAEGVAFCALALAGGNKGSDFVTQTPAYATADDAVSAVLSGSAGFSPYGPENIELLKVGQEFRINADLPTGGFAVGWSYEVHVPLGVLAAGDYMLQYSGNFNGEFRILDEQLLTVHEAVPSTQAYTMYHHGIDHFFVTADINERDSAALDGWHSVDAGFKVWPANGPAPDAAQPVCRFYSALVNSHFYTASEDECAYLQSFNSGWTYEGIAFQALVSEGGACPSGTAPVWRMFNNRHDIQDSNHRFVMSEEMYRIMIRKKKNAMFIYDTWAGEGVAFCSPP